MGAEDKQVVASEGRILIISPLSILFSQRWKILPFLNIYVALKLIWYITVCSRYSKNCCIISDDSKICKNKLRNIVIFFYFEKRDSDFQKKKEDGFIRNLRINWKLLTDCVCINKRR